METIKDFSAAACASAVLETAPMMMRALRTEFRNHRSPDLSVPQFRTLAFLGRQGDASLSQVAEHIGITLPSASKLVDRLILKKYATRKIQARDRRQIQLRLTSTGSLKVEEVRRAAKIHLTHQFLKLGEKDLKQIIQSMQILKTVFACNSEKCHKRTKQ